MRPGVVIHAATLRPTIERRPGDPRQSARNGLLERVELRPQRDGAAELCGDGGFAALSLHTFDMGAEEVNEIPAFLDGILVRIRVARRDRRRCARLIELN